MSPRVLALSLLATSALVWGVASCASQGEESPAPPSDDAGAADDGRSIITEPDSARVEACADGRWCAVNPPVPAPISLNGIWGTGPNNVWIAASPDLAIHWNGREFTSAQLNANHTLYGIWGSGAADVWAFAAGNVLWHNASEQNRDWSRFDKDAGGDPPTWSGPVFGMWGRTATDIWAVGPYVDARGQPTVWHADGWNNGVPNWIPSITTADADPYEREPSFNAVWGTEGGEVWVVGDKGKTRYSKGWKDGAAKWVVVDSWTSLPLYALWDDGKGTVWAAGGGGAVRRFIHQTDDSVVVEQVPFPRRVTIRALTGFGPDDIWAAGGEGTLAHWDGTAWSLVDLSATAVKSNELFAVWASSREDIWVVGRNSMLHKGSTLLPGTLP